MNYLFLLLLFAPIVLAVYARRWYSRLTPEEKAEAHADSERISGDW